MGLAPNVSITRSRGSGKTGSLTRTFETKTGQLIERGARRLHAVLGGSSFCPVLLAVCCFVSPDDIPC